MPSEGSSSKKIVKLRTFADDVARARKTTPATKKPDKKRSPAPPKKKFVVAKKAQPKPEEKPVVAPTPEPKPEPALPVEEKTDIETIDIPTIEAEGTPVSETETVTEEGPIEVPPFHSLLEKQETVPKKKSAPTRVDPELQVRAEHALEQIPTAAQGTFESENVLTETETGTVVTDKKRERYSFFVAIATSIKNWFVEKHEAYQESRRPKYFVERAASRKAVIEEAATDVDLAPRDDHKEVAQRLKEVERTDVDSKFRFKKAEAVVPSWHHYGEGEQTAETPSVPHDEKKEPHGPVRGPLPSEATLAAARVQKEQPSAPVQQPTPTPAVAPAPPQTPITKPPAPTPAPTVTRPKTQTLPTPAQATPPQPLFGKQSVLPIIIVICVATVLGVGATTWYFTRDTNTADSNDSVVANPPDTLVETSGDQLTYIPIGTDQIDFYTRLIGIIGTNPVDVIELRAVLDTQVLTAEEIANTFAWSAPGNFTRSVTEISFGGLDGDEPFIVMKFTNFDTAFAGLLQWESQMLNDLAPLFGEAVPTERIDTRVNNRDIHVLVDSTNQDRLVYGFLDKNTVLITTNRTTFSTVASRVY